MKIKMSKNQWELIGKKTGWIKTTSISRADVEDIKKLRDRSTVGLQDAKNFQDVIKDCVNLSSGTLATLTGKSNYVELDEIQNDFVFFTKTMIPRKHYETWMEAWNDFCKKTDILK